MGIALVPWSAQRLKVPEQGYATLWSEWLPDLAARRFVATSRQSSR
jgi:hypothetical protein